MTIDERLVAVLGEHWPRCNDQCEGDSHYMLLTAPDTGRCGHCTAQVAALAAVTEDET